MLNNQPHTPSLPSYYHLLSHHFYIIITFSRTSSTPGRPGARGRSLESMKPEAGPSTSRTPPRSKAGTRCNCSGKQSSANFICSSSRSPSPCDCMLLLGQSESSQTEQSALSKRCPKCRNCREGKSSFQIRLPGFRANKKMPRQRLCNTLSLSRCTMSQGVEIGGIEHFVPELSNTNFLGPLSST